MQWKNYLLSWLRWLVWRKTLSQPSPSRVVESKVFRDTDNPTRRNPEVGQKNAVSYSCRFLRNGSPVLSSRIFLHLLTGCRTKAWNTATPRTGGKIKLSSVCRSLIGFIKERRSFNKGWHVRKHMFYDRGYRIVRFRLLTTTCNVFYSHELSACTTKCISIRKFGSVQRTRFFTWVILRNELAPMFTLR